MELDNYFLLKELSPKFPWLHCISVSCDKQKDADVAKSPDADVTYVSAILSIAVDITGFRSPIQCNL